MSAQVALWLSAGTAVLLALLRLAQLKARWVHPRLFNSFVVRVCQAGNWERAVKLCQSGPASPYCVAVLAVLKSLRGTPGSSHPLLTGSSLASLFEQTLTAQGKRLHEPRWLTWLAWLLLAGPPLQGLALIRTMPKGGTYLLLLALGVALMFGALVWIDQMTRVSAQAGAELLPLLIEAHARSSASPREPAPPPAPPAPFPAKDSEAGPTRLILRVYRGDTFLEERSFDREVIKIGSMASSHLGAGEPSLARMHAVIELTNTETAHLIDLASASGTYVNGTRLDKSPIRLGDELRFGELRAIVKYLAATRWLN